MFPSVLRIAAVDVVAVGVMALGTGLIARQVQIDPQQEKGPQPSAAGREKKENVDLCGDPLPPGAIARLGTVRFRSSHVVAFSADSKSLISFSGQQTLSWSDADTGKLIRQMDMSSPVPGWIALSADSKLLASAGYDWPEGAGSVQHFITFRDAATGKGRRTIKLEDAESPSAIAISPDSKNVACVHRDQTVRLWDVETGIELQRAKVKARLTQGLAFSPDGSILATGSDAALYLWEWNAGKEPREIAVPDCGVHSLAFSPDGKKVLTGGTSKGVVQLWDVESGRLLHTLSKAKRYGRTEVAYSPDGKIVAAVPTYQSKEVQFWDPETGKELHRLDIASENANHLLFSPDSKRLAVRMASRIRVWNVDSWKEASVDDAAHREGVGQVAFSPRDGLVVTISDDGSARIWEATTGRQQATLHHARWLRGVVVSPDGKRIATSSLDDTVRMWDMETAKEVFKLAGHGRTGGSRVLGFSPDGKRLASWGDDWYLRVFDTATGKALLEHKIRPTDLEIPEDDDEDLARTRKSEILMMAQGALSPDSRRFVIAVGASVYVFDVESGKETLRINANEDGLIDRLVISPDGTRLLAGAGGRSIEVKNADGSTSYRSGGPTVRIWDLATGKQLLRNVLTEIWIGQVAFSPDGKNFAAAVIGRRSAAYVWDSSTGKEVHVIDCPLTDAHGVAFSPDGKLLVVGRTDTTALVYDLAALAAMPRTKKP